MQVRLTYQELMIAAYAGVNRNIAAIYKGRASKFGGHPWDPHIAGAAAEYAVCKALGRFRCGLEKLGAEDVQGLQVRSTDRPGGCLIVHDKDKDQDPFVLVIAQAPAFILAGWCWGHQAKQRKFWRENVPHPAYFVPQSELNGIESLTLKTGGNAA